MVEKLYATKFPCTTDIGQSGEGFPKTAPWEGHVRYLAAPTVLSCNYVKEIHIRYVHWGTSVYPINSGKCRLIRDPLRKNEQIVVFVAKQILSDVRNQRTSGVHTTVDS